jgi:hypothetical protein
MAPGRAASSCCPYGSAPTSGVRGATTSSVVAARRVAGQAALAGLEELLGPRVVQAFGDALAAAEGSDALLAAQALQHEADLLLGRVVLARAAADVAHHSLGGRLLGRRDGGFPGGRGGGFLAHLHSWAVTMSQKSSAPQRPGSVS